MRYENRVYGTREEIIKAIESSISGPHGSPRRQARAERALEELRKGWIEVQYGTLHYVVEEIRNEPQREELEPEDMTDR